MKTLLCQPPRRAGMTLLEIMVATAMLGVLIPAVYAIVYTGTLVSVKGFAINSTGTAARLSMDRMQLIFQSAYETPTLVDTTGKAITGNGPAAGVRFYRYVAAPYVLQIPQGGLSGKTKTLTIVCDARAEGGPPTPEPNDALVINTTILMTGQTNQLRAVVSAVELTGTANNKRTYKITLKSELTGHSTVLPDDGTTVTATLLRPTAILARGNRELVMVESYPEQATINFNTANPRVLTDQLAPPSGGLQQDKPFRLVTIEQRPFLQIDLNVRDNRYDNYLSKKQKGGFASYSTLQSRVAFKCDPNQL